MKWNWWQWHNEEKIWGWKRRRNEINENFFFLFFSIRMSFFSSHTPSYNFEEVLKQSLSFLFDLPLPSSTHLQNKPLAWEINWSIVVEFFFYSCVWIEMENVSLPDGSNSSLFDKVFSFSQIFFASRDAMLMRVSNEWINETDHQTYPESLNGHFIIFHLHIYERIIYRVRWRCENISNGFFANVRNFRLKCAFNTIWYEDRK